MQNELDVILVAQITTCHWEENDCQ